MKLLSSTIPKIAVVVSVSILTVISIPAGADGRANMLQDQDVFRQSASNGAEDTAEERRSFPYLDVAVLIEIQNDYIYDSDDPGSKINDLSTTTEPVFALHLLPGLFIEAGLVLEPVLDPAPSMDRFFEDEGIFVEVFSLNYENEWFSLVGGKFTPNFGTAWDRAPGIYGADFAEDYELVERIGFGGAVSLNTENIGVHTLSASTFFLDKSILSESAFANRGRTRGSDGGPSNTGDFSSFAISLDGAEMPGLDGLSYHGAVAYQDVGQPGEDTELGLVFGMSWEGDIGNGIELAPIVEVAYFENADGVWGQDRYYLTTGLGVGYEGWNLAVSHTGRTTTMSGIADINDHLVQISAGYLFDFGLAAEAGWALVREDGSDNYAFGILLAYEFGFCVGCPD